MFGCCSAEPVPRRVDSTTTVGSMATNGRREDANGSSSRRPFPVDSSDEDIQSSRSKRARRTANGQNGGASTSSRRTEKRPEMKDSGAQTLAPKKRAPLSDAETKELYELDCKKWTEIVEKEFWLFSNADGSLSARWPKKLNVPRKKFWKLYYAEHADSEVPYGIDDDLTSFRNLKLCQPPWFWYNFDSATRYRYPDDWHHYEGDKVELEQKKAKLLPTSELHYWNREANGKLCYRLKYHKSVQTEDVPAPKMASANAFLSMATLQMESELDKHTRSAHGIQKEFDHLSTKMKKITKQLEDMNDHTALYEGILKLRKEAEASKIESEKQLQELVERKQEMEAQQKELEKSRTEAEARQRELEKKVLDTQNRLDELEKSRAEAEQRASEAVAPEPSSPATTPVPSWMKKESARRRELFGDDFMPAGVTEVSTSEAPAAPTTKTRSSWSTITIRNIHPNTTTGRTTLRTKPGHMEPDTLATELSSLRSNFCTSCDHSLNSSFRVASSRTTSSESNAAILHYARRDKEKQPYRSSELHSDRQNTDTENQWVEDLGLRMPIDILDLTNRYVGCNTPELAMYWSKTLDQQPDKDFDRLMRWVRLQHPTQTSQPEAAIKFEPISLSSDSRSGSPPETLAHKIGWQMRTIYEIGSDSSFRTDSSGNENPFFDEQMDRVYYRLTGKTREEDETFHNEVMEAWNEGCY